MRYGTLVALLLAIGCAGRWQLPWQSTTTPEPSPPVDGLLAEADAEALAGHHRNALTLYEDLVRDHPGEEVAARALHAIVVLRLDSRSSVRDRRAAQQVLARLASEYPGTSWGREARLWRLLFREIDRCEAEATRLGADADRLRQTLDSLRDSDLELENHP